LRVGHAN